TTTTVVTTTTSTTGAPTTTTTICNCCTNTKVLFTTAAPSATVAGTVQSTGTCSGPPNEPCDATADCTSGTCGGAPQTTLHLTAGGLYFGGNGVGVPLPSKVPDLGESVLNVTSCAAPNFSLT